jgi:hypothetical protein
MANWIETNILMTFDKLWPRVEVALTGRSKEDKICAPAKWS